MTLASSSPKRDGAAVLPADGGSEPCSFESTTPRTCRSAGRMEGEQLSSWKILVPMRLPQWPLLSSECAQAMVCVRLPAVKFKRRVQVTVWAGTFVRFAAFEVAGRLLGVLGHEGAVAALAIEHF